MSSAGMRIEDCVLDQEYEYPESPLMNRNNRSRRVTVTEITEEVDDWEMVTGSDEESGTTTNSEDEEMSDEDSSDDGEDEFDVGEGVGRPSEMIPMDEAFQLLDDMVADWKTKLETVVSDGLKKLRRNGKEKRTMAKYIPGQQKKITDGVKAAILQEWLSEFKSAMAEIRHKIGGLAKEKMEEAEIEIMEKVLPEDLAYDQTRVENNVNKNKKMVVNLKFGDTIPQENCLRQLLLDLENVCNLFHCDSDQDSKVATIPAYKPNIGVTNKNLALDWRNERNSFYQRYFEPLRHSVRRQETVKDILDNFIIKNYAGCDNENVVEPLMKIKSTRRLPHLNMAQKKVSKRNQDRMREGKEQVVSEKSNSGKYSLLQVTKDGKERFFIVKKKEKPANDSEEAEEIFAEWHRNLNVPIPLVTLKKHDKKRNQRMSQRVKRRQILQEAKKENIRNTPVLYADMVKKNLMQTIEAEDIFESWLNNLTENNAAPEETKLRDNHLETDDLDIFKVWRHNFVTREKKLNSGGTETEENILSTALPFRLELSGGGCATIPVYRSPKTDLLPCSPKRAKIVKPLLSDSESDRSKGKAKSDNLEADDFFSEWRRNFIAPNTQQTMKAKKMRKQQPPMPENVFSDWLSNFKEPSSFWMRQDVHVRRKPLRTTKRQSVLDDLDSLIDKEDQVMEMVTAKPNKKKLKNKAKK